MYTEYIHTTAIQWDIVITLDHNLLITLKISNMSREGGDLFDCIWYVYVGPWTTSTRMTENETKHNVISFVCMYTHYSEIVSRIWSKN